ncbi:hypothetical protein ADL06_09580 [Streptomyces sp. NRRL F-6491]|nr:hypothetical protein ADL06_09580 [Streptomyces sp. NRRL F-6491]KOX49619.1 hypothetical protein ADL08_08275 [Streptomyces sp. NRRL F-6492]
MAMDPERIRRLAREADEAGRRTMSPDEAMRALAALVVVDAQVVMPDQGCDPARRGTALRRAS